ncbi:RING/FYVE/PHD zinc finger superfamily protein, putative [Theobroma cacao]|uniref:RING/FYVE/PHD zinc finger superfamily protein, putative n=1 Tax=Theobroma cacao TaxID=3641 RepID=A0A061FHX5_THECC|nr:RING/FYVE/PHD zinc finger superfamily protein, putative [Theobroma cacao]
MSIPIIETCRKRKRRPKLFGLRSFAEPGCPINPTGPFRDNIRFFLKQCAEPEDYCVNGMPIWCTLLVHENKSSVVPLYTIKEDVKLSSNPFCDHCRCTGWSNHFVSKRKYHVVIPNDRDWNKPLEDGVLNIHSHLLHGLIHCNGFGHLLCINGIEGGSKYLCGREIMDLWDRICEILRARKISVEDVSKKHGMDLRLLHGVAYGHTWFGRWGYKFCRGSYGVSEKNYGRAIEILSSSELDKINQDFSDREQCRQIKCIIQHYRVLSESQLVTIRDLFKFMLTIKSRSAVQKKSVTAITAPSASSQRNFIRISLPKKATSKEKSSKCKRFTSVIAHMDSRWPAKRLEYAAEVIVDALKEHKSEFCHGGMTRQDLRDAARMHIGDTGLLDYVLKSMNNVIVGCHIVRRAINTSRILEYTIDDIDNGFKAPEAELEIHHKPLPDALPALVPGTDVYDDVVYLYNNVLLDYPESEFLELATQAVLDSKHFVKERPFRDEDDQLLRFFCQVMPNLFGAENILTKKSPAGELVTVPLHATVLDLKQAVEKALRDTYCIMDKLVVTDIVDLGEMDDRDVLFGALESGAKILVSGSGIDLDSNLRHEGGADNWIVRCECGAQDDDGERMVSCDICEVWQHTRCCGIEDSEAVPPLFVCPGCCASLGPPMSESPLTYQSSDDLLLDSETVYGMDLEYDNCIRILP